MESARDSQQDARQEITDALTEFGRVVAYEGGDLEVQYERLAVQLEDSEQQLRQTRARYGQMLAAMKRAEGRLEPALQPLRDQVLFMKHNLNARAIAGLKGEVARMDRQVTELVAELNRAIAEANRFIAEMDGGG